MTSITEESNNQDDLSTNMYIVHAGGLTDK